MRKNYLILSIMLFSCVIAFSLVLVVSGKNLHVDEFGITKSEPINSGFVFVEGQYLDAPYVVIRKGLAVFINDKMVESPMTWPPKPQPSGDIDPEIPPEITKDTSIHDEIWKNYIREKRAYVQKYYTREEERRIMEQLYRGLPFVKEAKLDEEHSNILHVTTFKGEVDPIALTIPRRRPKIDRESVLQRVEATKKHFEDDLKSGDCIIFSNGGRLYIGGGNVTGRLPKLLEVLRSSKSSDEKFEAVQQAGFPYIREDSFQTIVTNFSASPQLEQRLNELIQKSQQKIYTE